MLGKEGLLENEHICIGQITEHGGVVGRTWFLVAPESWELYYCKHLKRYHGSGDRVCVFPAEDLDFLMVYVSQERLAVRGLLKVDQQNNDLRSCQNSCLGDLVNYGYLASWLYFSSQECQTSAFS